MRKKTHIAVRAVVFAALVSACAAAAQAPALPDPAPPVNLQGRVQVGEELEYELTWHGMPAGRAVLQVLARRPLGEKDGPETWDIRLDIRSSRAISTFYEVHDKAHSEVDVKGGFSRFYYQKRQEEDYRSEELIKCDYTLDRMEAGYSRPRPDGKWQALPVPLPGKVLDPLCAVYYLRGVDLETITPEKPLVLPVCTERRVWGTPVRRLSAEALAAAGLREEVDIPQVGAQQPCYVLVPDAQFGGPFVRKGPVTLWFHKATRVLVKVKAETPSGPCEAVLLTHTKSPLDGLAGTSERR